MAASMHAAFDGTNPIVDSFSETVLPRGPGHVRCLNYRGRAVVFKCLTDETQCVRPVTLLFVVAPEVPAFFFVLQFCVPTPGTPYLNAPDNAE